MIDVKDDCLLLKEMQKAEDEIKTVKPVVYSCFLDIINVLVCSHSFTWMEEFDTRICKLSEINQFILDELFRVFDIFMNSIMMNRLKNTLY